ncbi:carboxylesterase/lipase family protein [Devosia sp. MC532]|uniref:carboxylesterase/lipase family protein n=1 Tax=Devosia sp. MC532 TaxID=2799788 RepID=UPI0018F74AD2|nr:carboxylesterase family protein [Devosia sp. MC532]MBJ7579321.1 carboxylesterase/lipase family protein [Devosia sp. MC532]
MRLLNSLLLGGSMLAMLAVPTLAQQIVVETSNGKIAGQASTYVDGVSVFKGIRYAADAGGANRFLPPQPVPAIDGIYDTSNYGATCYGLPYAPILMPEEGVDLDPNAPSEDCLFLNVWTPGVDSGKRPVMVWMHGGGFTGGSGGTIRYEASRFVDNQDVVVVTLNHRLASLGFMDVSAVAGDAYKDSGNAGMLDIVQALRWVRDNIEELGGDPSNVTVFGESGGGSKVTTLMSMPSAQGLFSKVIAQSGIATAPITVEAAQASTATVLEAAGVTDLASLQSADVTKLVAGGNWGPVQGSTLPRGPFAPDADPAGKSIPLIIGSNFTESTFFNNTPTKPVDADGLKEAFAKGNFTGRIPAERIDALMDGYRALLPGTPDHEVFQIIASDIWMTQLVSRVADLRSGQDAETYVYHFTQRQGGRDGELNVPHTAEIAYVFDNLDLAKATVGEPDADDRALATVMSTAWANFARTGNPNGEGVPEWKTWNDGKNGMLFGASTGSVADPFAARLAVLGEALKP